MLKHRRKAAFLVFVLTGLSAARAETMSLDVTPDTNMVDGRIYLERGDYRASIRAYELALAGSPTDYNRGVAHSNICIAYMRVKNWRKAAEHCDAAVALEPGNWSYRNNRATLLFFMGRLNEAKAQYEETLALAPDQEILQRNVKLVSDLLRRGRGANVRGGERSGAPVS